MSRRTLLLGGVGAVVAAGVGGVGLVEAGLLPGRARLDSALGWDGGGGTTPDVEPGLVVSGSFPSAARRTQVGYSILRPPGATGPLPVAVALHGRSGDHLGVLGLHCDRYLAAAVQSGVPPFALVSVDGGDNTYWHPRASGDDPPRMIVSELLPLLHRAGLMTDRFALTGWSMGGYGALLLAEQLGPKRIASVAAISPAIFAGFGASSPGSFDSQADFDAHDVQAGAGKLSGVPVLIDCGTDDPFAAEAKAMRDRLTPPPAGELSRGAHNDRYWTRVAPEQMAFLGRTLSST